jgi:hypothetical protein
MVMGSSFLGGFERHEAGTLNRVAEFPFSACFTADPVRGLPYADVF